MQSRIAWKDMAVGIGVVIATGAIVMLLKSMFYNYRRPNGKKGGVVSFHAATAFAIVTVIAMNTKDWFLTALAVVLAYLISRGRMDEGQHYLYQVVLGAIIGVAVPYGLYYMYYNKIGGGYGIEREEYADMPSRAVDDRHEADEAPELSLDLNDLDY